MLPAVWAFLPRDLPFRQHHHQRQRYSSSHQSDRVPTRLGVTVQSVQIRGIDPSETRISVGDTVVCQSDLPAYQMWQFESYRVQAIVDIGPDGVSTGQVTTLDQPVTDNNRARHVTLTSPRLRSPVTMRLAGLYSHGMSTLWILDNQL